MTAGEKPSVLIQLDPDGHSSVFDSVVAIDSGVDHLLTFDNVEPLDVRGLVHGAMFTRGSKNLHRTAIFIGGSSVQAGEQLLRSVLDSFFGELRVSVMLDSNGANTTAAAAVLSLESQLEIAGRRVAVAGGTGSVGRRVAWLAARRGATVVLVSRSDERAADACDELRKRDESLDLEPAGGEGPYAPRGTNWLDDCDAVIAAGAAGVRLLESEAIEAHPGLRVAIDLNAVPPGGIGGIEPSDEATRRGELIAYGAIGVGKLKMKIHRRCIESLFESTDRVLDVDEIHATGRSIVQLS